jgi:hypothetical protein
VNSDQWINNQFQNADEGMPGSGNSEMDLQVNTGWTAGQGTEIGPPVLPQLQPLPTATNATMPTMTGTANVYTNRQQGSGRGQRGGKTPTAITPQYLNQRLPSIVNPAPAVVPPDCGGGITDWIGDNPLLAGAGLILLGMWVWGRK